MADPIRTNAGWAGYGDNYFRGYSLRDELFPNEPSWSAMSLAVGHRRLSESECRYLDALALAIYAPDPRIWPVKMVWLCSSYGSAHAGLAAAHLFVEGTSMGPGTAAKSARVWRELATLDGHELALEAWFRERRAAGELIAGFGVPGRSEDERVVLIQRAAELHGMSQGVHLRTLAAVQQALGGQGRLRPNAIGAVAAAIADLGFTDAQVEMCVFHALTVPLWGHAVAAAGDETLRQLPRACTEYAGRAPRASTRSLTTRPRTAELTAVERP
jgi:hypothetical protein